MGVPVITHTGKSYVNRMSTAVMNGAGLSDCVATHYLNMCLWLEIMHPIFLHLPKPPSLA